MTELGERYYWVDDDGAVCVYIGPDGVQGYARSRGRWIDWSDDAGERVTDSWIRGGDWSGPSKGPAVGIPPAPRAGAPMTRHAATHEGVTYEWSGALRLTTEIVVGGARTTVGDFLAAHDGADLPVVDAIEVAARADVLASGRTDFACLEAFGSTFARRLAAGYGWLDGELVPLPRLDAHAPFRPHGTRPPAFDAAAEALHLADLYPMSSPEYRRGVQRGYQLLTQASAETDDPDLQCQYQDIARDLAMSLAIDWTEVELVEVRYADGTTATLDIGGDPAATEQMRGAVAFRIVPPLD